MSIVHLDPDKAKELTIFLGQRNEEGLTLCDLLKYPERYSEVWKQIYYTLTGSRLETKSERKFGEMIDKYMGGNL